MNTTSAAAPAERPAPMSVFERWLTVWVFLCIFVGIGLGRLPGSFRAIGRMEVAKVNLPVGLLISELAVPILIQVFFNSALAYWLNRRLGETHDVAGPSALIAASNFFELAVAATISVFGFECGAVVGVLIEVLVMLLVVRVVNRSKEWYEEPPARRAAG